ncbi:MAG: hypothetical protein AAB395_00580 [Patescibacteria group bacterium]
MKKFIIKLHITLIFAAGLLGFVPSITQTAMAGACLGEVTILTISPWYHGLCESGTNDVQFDAKNPAATLGKIGINLLSIALQVTGYISVGFVIWGGFKYILAAGDSGKLASAKSIIQNALIGLLIALSAVAILNVIQSIV